MFSASGFSLFRITFNIALLGWLIRLMDGTVVLAQLQVTLLGNVIISDCVHVVGHSPNFQSLLHIIVSASIMASPPAFINSDGMLSIHPAFPVFRNLTAASTSSCSTGKSSSSFFIALLISLYLVAPSVVLLSFFSCLRLSHISSKSPVTQGFFFWRCFQRILLAVSVTAVLKLFVIVSSSSSAKISGANFPSIIA